MTASITASIPASWEKVWEAVEDLNVESLGTDPVLDGLIILCSMCAAFLPVALLLALLWWLDRHHREPLWVLTLVFVWGAFIATTLSLLGNTILSEMLENTGWLNQNHTIYAQHTIIAPLIEESAKAAIVILLARSRYLVTMTDGFLYGAIVGIGFGMTENFLYFSNLHEYMLVHPDPASGFTQASANAYTTTAWSRWINLVMNRSIGSAVMHAASSSCLGAALAWARYRRPAPKSASIFVGCIAAMGMHGLWNGLASVVLLAERNPELLQLNVEPMLLPTFGLELVIIYCTYQLCLLQERRIIRNELLSEARNHGSLPVNHAPILANYTARKLHRFAPPGVSQHAYIDTTTTLAFYRHHARHAHGNVCRFYQSNLPRVREELRIILQQRHANLE